jgi:hypothetical protein
VCVRGVMSNPARFCDLRVSGLTRHMHPADHVRTWDQNGTQLLERGPLSEPRGPRIAVSADVKANPRPSCSQQGVTIRPEAGAKLRQSLLFGSSEWQRTYATLGNTMWASTATSRTRRTRPWTTPDVDATFLDEAAVRRVGPEHPSVPMSPAHSFIAEPGRHSHGGPGYCQRRPPSDP